MLKGDDFLEEAGNDQIVRDGLVGTLALALEQRGRWNTAGQIGGASSGHAVRAVIALNDCG